MSSRVALTSSLGAIFSVGEAAVDASALGDCAPEGESVGAAEGDAESPSEDAEGEGSVTPDNEGDGSGGFTVASDDAADDGVALFTVFCTPRLRQPESRSTMRAKQMISFVFI